MRGLTAHSGRAARAARVWAIGSDMYLFQRVWRERMLVQDTEIRMGMDSFYVRWWAAGIRQASRKHGP